MRSGNENTAAWIRILIKNVKEWVGYKHKKPNFHLTQFLMDQGSFRSYTKRIGKTANDGYPSCGETDDPEHIFRSRRWKEQRRNIQTEIGVEIHARNVINLLLGNDELWNASSKLIIKVFSFLFRRSSEKRRELERIWRPTTLLKQG